jgi:hypothetical protein
MEAADPASPYVRVKIDGRDLTFADDVADVLLAEEPPLA